MNLFRPTYETEKDEQLMKRVAHGDGKAFGVLYDRYSSALFRYFHRMLWQNKEKAEDFVQDLFMKIIHKPESFDRERKFITWLYSVAHNMCKNEYRSQEVRKPVREEKAVYALAGEHGDSFGTRVDRKMFMKKLATELDLLDESQRTTFLLRYEENFSIKEIADVLECSEGTVKSRLFYTLKKLSGRLEEFAPDSKGVKLS
ncbi:MAG TPA: RNA polymerase sigma factor [Bacteroidia bacterium]|jgi:RNA polymerase sigma-70 factor (ECF subfamily)|nr:RNA polymerase sigma factor [Bacteroidia bacterium]